MDEQELIEEYTRRLGILLKHRHYDSIQALAEEIQEVFTAFDSSKITTATPLPEIGVPTRICDKLESAKILTIGDLLSIDEYSVLSIPQLSMGSVLLLSEKLAEHDIEWPEQ